MIRPSFNAAWAAAYRIYNPADPGNTVARVIGGKVAANIQNPSPTQRWTNTCAVRMSYILGQAGLMIPAIRGKTVSGANGRQYFFRVRDLIAYLTQCWGRPQTVEYPVSQHGALKDQQGVIVFEVIGWSDAQGQATLFNGHACYDQCYFDSPEARFRTTRANFWSLP